MKTKEILNKKVIEDYIDLENPVSDWIKLLEKNDEKSLKLIKNSFRYVDTKGYLPSYYFGKTIREENMAENVNDKIYDRAMGIVSKMNYAADF